MNYSLSPQAVKDMGDAMESHRTQKTKAPHLSDVLKQHKMQARQSGNWGNNSQLRMWSSTLSIFCDWLSLKSISFNYYGLFRDIIDSLGTNETEKHFFRLSAQRQDALSSSPYQRHKSIPGLAIRSVGAVSRRRLYSLFGSFQKQPEK